ncbi:hypothetical protein NB693_20705 [Pantoea ananatis]|uniref:hypothetical protein n=1 Tax=Pantoea ananas TaxID=553 RepID=UPI00221F8917|nr:hypothetical protein [Pantoea ananatis]
MSLRPFACPSRGALAGLRSGDPQGPKALALHGWLDNAASFVPLSRHLPQLELVGARPWPQQRPARWRRPGAGRGVSPAPAAPTPLRVFPDLAAPVRARMLLAATGSAHA